MTDKVQPAAGTGAETTARIAGHAAAALPVASVVFAYFWLGLRQFDKHLNVVGPPWYLAAGGNYVALFGPMLCLSFGLVAIAYGLKVRRRVPVIEGIWACLMSVAIVFVCGVLDYQ